MTIHWNALKRKRAAFSGGSKYSHEGDDYRFYIYQDSVGRWCTSGDDNEGASRHADFATVTGAKEWCERLKSD